MSLVYDQLMDDVRALADLHALAPAPDLDAIPEEAEE